MGGGVWGKYNISGLDYEKFLKLYKKIYKKNQQYVVERPLTTSYLFLDIDWHFSDQHSKRQYKSKHVLKIIKETNKILLDTFNIKNDILTCFVHEKKKPTLQKSEYKDGFHIFYPDIPLKFNYRYYIISKLKEVIIKKNIFQDIPFTNNIDDVVDTSIVIRNGTLMYNSCKENKEPYKITKIYDCEYNVISINEYLD